MPMGASLLLVAVRCTLLVGLFAVAVPAAEVRLLDSGPDYVIVEYRGPDTDASKDLKTDQLLTHRGAAHIGIPLDAEPRVEVLSASARIVPEREWEPAAEQDAHLQGPAVINQIDFVRDQRVAELAFVPRQLPDGTWEVFDHILVRLTFGGSGGSPALADADRWGEHYLQRLVLNYRQARAWRRPRPRPARRPADVPVDTDLLRLRVRHEGMYRLTGADLQAAGLDLDRVDPVTLRLYYGGGRPLDADSPGVVRQELPLIVSAADGRFGPADYLLFHAVGPSRWEYCATDSVKRYLHNLYTHDNVYWLASGAPGEGLRTPVQPSAAPEPGMTPVSSYRERLHEEYEQHIAVISHTISSGLEWYWETFTGNARNYPVVIRNAGADTVDITLGFHGVGGQLATFDVRWNDEPVASIPVPGLGYSQHRIQAPAGAREGTNTLGLFHTNNAPMRFDFYQLEYSRGLVAQRGELRFDAPAGTGLAEYRLAGFTGAAPRVFQVEPALAEITGFDHDAAAGTVVFRAPATDPPRRYVVLEDAGMRRPASMERVRHSGLRRMSSGAEYLIITHADFHSSAERLAAWRGADDRFGTPLSTRVVDVQHIYDEFSGGMLDPTALRAFLRHAYETWSTPPFFVLLLGDGTYDYKNNTGVSPGNWIPAYQDRESTYDEWYVSVAGDDILPDMAIGRIPVQTASEAAVVIDKLIDYDRNPERGPWQSRGMLIADDLRNPEQPDLVESYFLLDAEYMARNLLPEDLNLRKLYLAQYPLEGHRKPAARAAFLRRFNQGGLYVTYLGHGNPDVLAHEHMFVVSRDLDEIRNDRRLPLFYTAASQVGVFDDPYRISMPEALLRRAEGGVIAMISATRVGYHGSNMVLANAFHELLFRAPERHVPVGMALMQAKHRAQVGMQNPGRTNIRRYSLFGDPAQYLARPRYQVELSVQDTMPALGKVHIQGQVLDQAGQPVPDYDGQAWIQAFDSTVLSQLDGFPYEQLGSELLRGVYPVRQGRFEAMFRVPKDITYGGKNGRVSAYVWNGTAPAACGARDGIVLAGTAEDVEVDLTGPDIRLGFVGQEEFNCGDTIPPSVRLRAEISDPSGINVTGETGHEIELRVGNRLFVVTEYFSVQGDYRHGTLEYRLPLLEPGPHDIRLKAWDTFNNSSEAHIVARVSDRAGVVLSRLLFHPNPLRGDTGFFTFNLDTRGQQARIRVFTLSGRLVDELVSPVQTGYNQVAWTPETSLANGVYPYQIEIEQEGGKRVQRNAVLQLMR